MELIRLGKEPEESKIKSSRRFIAPKSRIIKGRRIKIIDIGPKPEKIRVEVDVPDLVAKDGLTKKTHDVISTFEPGRMIIIWENEQDLRRNRRVPMIFHGDDIR